MTARDRAGQIRVGVTLGADTGGGIARYSLEVAVALMERASIAVVPIGTEKSIARLADRVGPAATEHGEILITRSSQLGEAAFIWGSLDSAAQMARLDVVHGTKHLLPRRSKTPTVLTIHDLTAIRRRSDFPLNKRVLLPRLYEAAVGKADALVAVSNAVADQVRDAFPIRGGRLTAIPHAVPNATLVGETTPIPRVGDRFALAVGDLSPRKNLEFLFRIWPEVQQRTGLTLVIAGSDGWKSERIRCELERLEDLEIGLRLGRVSDAELRWLYEAAAVCCMPSLEEGFGFPVIEAIGRGCPVVASTDPALIEAGQGLSTHVSPVDGPAWIEAIARTVVEGGRKPVRFDRSWADVAAELERCYRTVIQGSALSTGGLSPYVSQFLPIRGVERIGDVACRSGIDRGTLLSVALGGGSAQPSVRAGRAESLPELGVGELAVTNTDGTSPDVSGSGRRCHRHKQFP